MGEHCVRNAEVGSSSLLDSTNLVRIFFPALNTCMDIHECRVCKTSQPQSNFFKSGRHIDRICKVCKHESMQKRRQDFKQWCLKYKGGRCIVCGYNKSPRALHFHHLDPNQKDFKISNTRGNVIKRERIVVELDKCVLLCSNCHAEVHDGLLHLHNNAVVVQR